MKLNNDFMCHCQRMPSADCRVPSREHPSLFLAAIENTQESFGAHQGKY